MKKNSEDGQSSQSSLAESWSDLGSNSLEQACARSRAYLHRGALRVRIASRARSAPPLSVLSWEHFLRLLVAPCRRSRARGEEKAKGHGER